MGRVNHMDLDALAAAHGGEWKRLDQLAQRRSLRGEEVDELVVRYRSASADLADMKTSAGRTPQSDALSISLAQARLKLTGVRESLFAQMPRFFLAQLPAALYRVRWTTLAVAVMFVVVATTVAFWISSDPERVAALGSDATLRDYVDNRFTQYYNPAAEFAGQVWTNNAWIAAQCVMFGITGIFPAYAMLSNAVSVGTSGAILMAYDQGDVFLLHILPHGMLELTSIFVAGAAGLQIFWAWIAPGRRTRAQSLASAGRSLATITVGLVLALALSGVVEGFVTGQPWPWAVKLSLGGLALALFLSYMLVLGRYAHRRGEDGDLTEYEAGTPTLYAG